MADGNFRDGGVQGRPINLTDLMFAANPAQSDLSQAAASDTLQEVIVKAYQNPPSGLSDAEKVAVRAALGLDGAGIVALIDAALGSTAWRSGATPPAQQHNNYLGISADTTFDAAEFTVMDMDAALTIPTIPTGETRYVAYATPTAQLQGGNFSYVYLYQSGHRNTVNQIAGWMQEAAQVTLGGEAHTILRSRAAFAAASTGFIVEAG